MLLHYPVGGAAYPKTTLAFRDECRVLGFPARKLLLACALFPLFGLLGPALVAQGLPLGYGEPASSADTNAPAPQSLPFDVLPAVNSATSSPGSPYPKQQPPPAQPSLGPPAILIPRL